MLQLREIIKEYPIGEGTVRALKGVTLDFRTSEFVAVLGPSGCGKTTLLNIVGGLDSYTSGDLIINGTSTKDYKDADWDAYRNRSVGFVFQSYNLIGHQNALSNVEMALKISGISKADRRARAIAALEKVGLSDQLYKKPNMMSGGQMQRVAIARALVNDPEIILADEPTGALDSETSIQIMELLKEVAADRLVIMVTHNPELADTYASRIIHLKDGLIVSDSKPVLELESAAHELPTPQKRVKLGFLTALGLSINNLMTKKGRTFLTSFAGAIGIIGIALILALSNGMNNYIADIESDTMGTYPIELEKETFKFGGSSDGDMGLFMSGTDVQEASATLSDNIYSNNIVADSVASAEEMTAKNDLGNFRTYLDSNYGDIENSIAAVEYGYDVVPQVFRSADDGKVIQVSPSSLQEDDRSQGSGMMMMFGSGIGGSSVSGSTSSSWTQLPDNTDLRQRQYELQKGEWPTKPGEVALVIDENNQVSDYTLYVLGLMDINRMNELVEAVENGETYDDPQESFSFDDALGLEFRTFAQSDLYKESEDEPGIWIDKTKDEEYWATLYNEGTPLTIVGILKSTDEATASSGVVYTGKLTEDLMEKSANSAIIKQQLADPTINVFTGKPFEEVEDDDKEASDGAVEKADSAQGDTAATAVSYVASNNDAGRVISSSSHGGTIDTSAEVQQAIYKPNAALPATAGHQTQITSASLGPASQSAETDLTANDTPTDKKKEAATYSVRFLNYDGSLLEKATTYKAGESIKSVPKETPTRTTDATYVYSFVGWKSSTTKSVYTATKDLPVVSESVDYTAYYYASPVAAFGSGTNENNDGEGDMPEVDGIPGQGIIPGTEADMAAAMGLTGQNQAAGEYDLSSMMAGSGGAGSIDPSAFSGSATMDLSKDQLEVLLAQMYQGTPATYEDVLEGLGYADKAQPASIALFPADFAGKASIESFIESYNNQVAHEADKVTYTDIVGLLTSSITSIVDIISYVLIAFVAISLVVSSIMIAIITYISVLERTREIGVLRALGASKGDVSKIFNAETVIEGFASGVIGIVVTLILCIPINMVIATLFDAHDIAALPLEYSLILIGISVALTLIAGFVPSRMASKKDPVVALRSE